LVFKKVFPPRSDRWLRLAPQSTPAGPQRSGGVTDLCSVAGVDNVNGEGKLTEKLLGWNGTKRSEGESSLTYEDA